MVRVLALVPLLIALVFGGFFLWGLDPDRDPNALPSVLISQPAPDFALEPVEGLTTPGLSRADLATGDGPVIVNVFASWCVPCRAEHAVLTQLVEQENQTLFGINYKDKSTDAVRWLAVGLQRRICACVRGQAQRARAHTGHRIEHVQC